MTPLRVLITNITLAHRTGTEINVRDIALGLLRRGHTPIVFTRDPGVVADELRRATVTVVDDLGALGVPPDVVHGHHHPETIQALLHFPGAPAIFFSHDALAWHDAAPHFPRILRYVAVDDANRDRLVLQHGIDPARVRLVLNAVDLDRFRARGPLPPRPGRALVFSNYASDTTHLAAVREACRRGGIALDVVGANAGSQSSAPETLLGQYDLVFAKGRCALEALAVGAAVVLCDYSGLGPLVTSGELARLRRINFGRRALTAPLDADLVAREVARYAPDDAAEVTRRVRAEAGLEAQLDTLESLYRQVIAEHTGVPRDPAAEARALAVYLDAWGPRFKDGPLRALADEYRARSDAAEADRQQAHAACARLTEQVTALEARCAELERRVHAADVRAQTSAALAARLESEVADRRALADELAAARTEALRLQHTVDYVVQTATWRLRTILLRSRALAGAYRALRRVAALPARGRAAGVRPAAPGRSG